MWFAQEGAYYQFVKSMPGEGPLGTGSFEGPAGRCLMIRATFVGANPDVLIIGEHKMDYVCNYFVGNDPSRWRTGVANYEAIVYREIYPNTNLRYYGCDGEIKYDFIVLPGGDPARIRIRYEGAERLRVSGDGELIIETKWGAVTERRPLLYQVTGAGPRAVDGSYRLLSENSFGFCVEEEYDTQRVLVIDPSLHYSTYLGGSGSDYAWGMAVDDEGCAHVSGLTYSADFPTVAALQEECAGDCDIFVSKLAPSGDALIFSTYLGGMGREENPRLTLDDLGNVYVAGRTSSPDFPVVNGYSGTLNGASDAFVAKLGPGGDAIVYASFLGGTSDEWATGIAVDVAGSAYVVGITESSNFPTASAWSGELAGGSDAYLTKFTAGGDQLVFSTYLGGSKDDAARGIGLDQLGRPCLSGETYSRDFPVVNPLYGSLDGFCDGFVARFSEAGDDLIYSTYLGGSSNDWCKSIATDADNNIYVCGDTESDDFPTANAIQPDYAGGSHIGTDLFVAKLSSSGQSLGYSTYLGGADDDFGYGMAVDADGNVYLTGGTYSVDFPTYAMAGAGHSGEVDAFVTQMAGSGDSLVFSTLLGGSLSDIGRTVAFDPSGSVYITGYTLSQDFPTMSAYQAQRLGTRDGFTAKVGPTCCRNLTGNYNGDADDVLNVLDLVYAVEWIFLEGPPPPCVDEADVNGDGIVTVEDLIFIVDLLYLSGPLPVPCH
ncbi:MAG: SBBP repeat-containing protein [Candidatus Zixiibacteriota bacterium]|nr:MAG: SBBP repeat-containing protein [candidate division Zixibacteria bacterium]